MEQQIFHPFIKRSVMAANLRAAIQKSGMSARRICILAEVEPAHMSRFLKTGIGISPQKMKQVAAVLEINPYDLYAERDLSPF